MLYSPSFASRCLTACYSLMSGGGGKRNEERHDGNAVSGSGSVVEVSMYRRMTVRLSQSVGSRTLTMVNQTGAIVSAVKDGA